MTGALIILAVTVVAGVILRLTHRPDPDDSPAPQADGAAAEIEEFRQVLYTLIPSDVFGWGASLTRRRIALPDPLRDEWIMLCEDNGQL